MGKAVSRGQALQVAARVATQVNWDELDGDSLQTDIINLTPEEFSFRFTTFLKSGGWVTDTPKAYKFLSPKGQAGFCRGRSFNPAEFYQTRPGLFVWDGFRDWILPVAKPVKSTSMKTIFFFDLVQPANDAEIRVELPQHHVFNDTSAFCAYLADAIEHQLNGKEGNLLSNGYANIFYVRGINSEVFTVGVYWYSGDRRWRVNAGPRGGCRRSAGGRAFSSNC